MTSLSYTEACLCHLIKEYVFKDDTNPVNYEQISDRFLSGLYSYETGINSIPNYPDIFVQHMRCMFKELLSQEIGKAHMGCSKILFHTADRKYQLDC